MKRFLPLIKRILSLLVLAQQALAGWRALPTAMGVTQNALSSLEPRSVVPACSKDVGDHGAPPGRTQLGGMRKFISEFVALTGLQTDISRVRRPVKDAEAMRASIE
jgi:hypothetical protein